MKVLINDIENKENLFTLIISELRGQGIKHRKEKRAKNQNEKIGRRRMFNVPLHHLQLETVILANGSYVEIPQFVSEASQRILDFVETEGIFRKAGSTARQKIIISSLESGHQLGRDHHVIDIANVLKTFIRDLPEPLLPYSLQDALLRCLLCENTKYTLMITILLLPPLTLNTLAYLMQFLYTVSQQSHANKMTIENLAIILTPNIMPIAEMIQQRLNSHVRVVQLLIENANEIGVIPERLCEKFCDIELTTKQQQSLNLTDKKKKKRRSGSLTRMFNGFKKIVGAIGSSESLDKTAEAIGDSIQSTPCLSKSAKKRKVTDNISFSSKKKKDVLSLLPEGKNALLPNTPVVQKEPKKSRLSLVVRKQPKNNSRNSILSAAASVASIPPMERRWSVVGAPWNRKKNQQNAVGLPKHLSPVVSLSRLDTSDGEILECFSFGNSDNNLIKSCETVNDDDFITIPKIEYQAMVSALDTRMSQEFTKAQSTLLDSQAAALYNDDVTDCIVDGPRSVHNKYVKALEETELIGSNASTDQLAKRLSRELKIRRSAEHKIIRSPSARKIGTMRRRSRENVRLSRNQSWHLSSTSTVTVANVNHVPPNIESLDLSFYPKSNLKRGRPNTIQTGLRFPSPVKKLPEDEAKPSDPTENWTSADSYFGNPDNDQHDMSVDENVNLSNVQPQTPEVQKIENSPGRSSLRSSTKISTPRFVTNLEIGEIKTPMLPPRLPPRRTPGKTPLTTLSAPNSAVVAPIPRKTMLTPLLDQQTGRASIARLRSQNAGMVMAKAKLFDGLVENGQPVIATSLLPATKSVNPRVLVTQQAIPKTQMDRVKDRSPKKSTPRKKYNSNKSPGGISKRQKMRMARLQRSGDNRMPASDNKKILESLRTNLGSNSGNLRIVLEDCLSPSRSTNLNNNFLNNCNNRTPKIKGTLLMNSPRRINTPASLSRYNTHNNKTPLKAIPSNRQSPRLVAQKNNHNRSNSHINL